MQPLAGLLVVDLTRHLPGPFASRELLRLGARVVRLESPDGDPLRAIAPQWDAALNAGKESVVCDLKAEPELGRALCARADVVLEGFRPGVAARLGVGPDDVPDRVVYCSLTGFGVDGRHALRAGHDLNYLGWAGALADTAPALPPVQAADLGAGALAAVAEILAALLERERTGHGARLVVSMTHGSHRFVSHRVAGDPRPHLLTGGLACYRIYATADGRWLTRGRARSPLLRATVRAARAPRPRAVALRGRPAVAHRRARRDLRDANARRVARALRRGGRRGRPGRDARGGCRRPGHRRVAARPSHGSANIRRRGAPSSVSDRCTDAAPRRDRHRRGRDDRRFDPGPTRTELLVVREDGVWRVPRRVGWRRGAFREPAAPSRQPGRRAGASWPSSATVPSTPSTRTGPGLGCWCAAATRRGRPTAAGSRSCATAGSSVARRNGTARRERSRRARATRARRGHPTDGGSPSSATAWSRSCRHRAGAVSALLAGVDPDWSPDGTEDRVRRRGRRRDSRRRRDGRAHRRARRGRDLSCVLPRHVDGRRRPRRQRHRVRGRRGGAARSASAHASTCGASPSAPSCFPTSISARRARWQSRASAAGTSSASPPPSTTSAAGRSGSAGRAPGGR